MTYLILFVAFIAIGLYRMYNMYAPTNSQLVEDARKRAEDRASEKRAFEDTVAIPFTDTEIINYDYFVNNSANKRS